MDPWLARLRHDLIKHALWRARDLRDLTQPPTPGDIQALRRCLLDLRDDEGNQVTAVALWRSLRAESGAQTAALATFEQAVIDAEAAVRELDRRPEGFAAALEAVLRLEPAFAHLARELED